MTKDQFFLVSLRFKLFDFRIRACQTTARSEIMTWFAVPPPRRAARHGWLTDVAMLGLDTPTRHNPTPYGALLARLASA